MMKRINCRIAAMLLIVLLLSGCTALEDFKNGLDREENADTVKIGIFQPLSGVDKEKGEQEAAGIELAHKLYPEVNGKRVELVYADNRSDLDAAKEAADLLVQKDVDLVLGSYGSTLTLAGSDIFKEAEIPLINISCTNPLVTQGNDYVFRVCITESFQGTMAAKYVCEELQQKGAAIVKCRDDDRGAALAQAFADKTAQLTGEAEAGDVFIEYESGEKDFSAALDSIVKSGKNAVYLSGSAKDSAALIKQARERGMTQIFIGSDVWEDKAFIEIGGSAAEGACFTCYYDSGSEATEQARDFLQAYGKEHGKNAIPDQSEALAFDAYLLALDAFARAEDNSPRALRDALSKTQEFRGVTGTIRFDKEGDPIKSVMFKTVENGEFIHKYTEEPKWN